MKKALSRPPFQITPIVLRLSTEIGSLLGRYEGLSAPSPEPRLSKANQVRTIQGSLAIEGNTLSLDQVTAVLEGKRVAGPRRDVLEVQNAIKAYSLAPSLTAASSKDLLKAHAVTMAGLIPDAGKWRASNVGVIKGSKVAHVAPKAAMVPKLMSQLFAFLDNDLETPDLVKACVFHFELEFIHPFSDGNGRVGRLWQHVILLRVSPLFAFAPVESLIKDRQEDYYRALRASDKQGDATPFVEFSLAILAESLSETMATLRPKVETVDDRLEKAARHFGTHDFARKDYLALFKSISAATASRDLLEGVERGLLSRTGDKARARYALVRRSS